MQDAPLGFKSVLDFQVVSISYSRTAPSSTVATSHMYLFQFILSKTRNSDPQVTSTFQSLNSH